MTRNTFRIAVRKFGPFESAIRKQWESFERSARTGLVLEAEAMDLHPLSEALFEHEGLKRGDWDVGFLVTDWVARASLAGCLLDLSPFLASDPPEGYPDAWAPSLLRLQRVDNCVLGLPYHNGPECLIYRKDLFEDRAEGGAYEHRFGAPLDVPETWDEFRRIAQYFTRPERNLYGTTFAAYPDGHNTVYDFCLQLWTRGGELFDSGGRLRLETAQSIAGLEFCRTMLNDASAVHPGSREFDSVKSGLAFASGEVAMMVNWFGFAAMCETIPESKVKGRVAVAGVPRADGGSPTSLNIYWILSIGAGSPHRELAYRFLRHCASAPMDRLLTKEGAIGCRKSTWQDAEVNRTIPFYNRLDALHTCARELPRLSEWPRIAAIIDELVLGVINSDRPVPELARAAQYRVDVLAEVQGGAR